MKHGIIDMFQNMIVNEINCGKKVWDEQVMKLYILCKLIVTEMFMLDESLDEQ